MSMKCWRVSIIRTNRDPPPINNIHSQVPEGRYQGVAASLWVATAVGAELHYICIKKTCYEYEVWGGVSIIRTNRDPPHIPTTTSTLRSQRADKILMT